MNVLVIDIGGTHVKVLATGQDDEREFVSGPTLTPKRMVSGVRKLVADWKYEVISPVGKGQRFHARQIAPCPGRKAEQYGVARENRIKGMKAAIKPLRT
jgi:predicted NBD/HSP70 family sugar kinase